MINKFLPRKMRFSMFDSWINKQSRQRLLSSSLGAVKFWGITFKSRSVPYNAQSVN